MESADLDIISTYIHLAFSCIYGMSGGRPGHRSDCQRHGRCPRLQLSISVDVTPRDYVTPRVMSHLLQAQARAN